MELKQMTPAEFSAVYQERMTADFPADELRPLSSMKDLHAQGNYLVYGCYDEQGLAAYAALVLREDAALLDYYAVDASRRGQGVGQKCLSLLQKEPLGANFLLLEVESVESAQTPAQVEERTRRIRFYHHCGCSETPVYAHLFGVEFLILCLPLGGSPLPAAQEVEQAMLGTYRLIVPPIVGPGEEAFRKVCKVWIKEEG